MVVIFGKQLNHSSPIEVLTKMIIYFYLMMGKLLTTPMIYAEYSIIILHILLIVLVWMTLSINMILVNHVYLIMITIEVYARYVT